MIGRTSGDASCSIAAGLDDDTGGGAPRTLLASLLLTLVRLYRTTGVFRSPRCRFYPSCSSYALQAIRVHGGLRGATFTVRRLVRCHPWNPGGVDHVPQRK